MPDARELSTNPVLPRVTARLGSVLHRPVTPEVAGSSPVILAFDIDGESRNSYPVRLASTIVLKVIDRLRPPAIAASALRELLSHDILSNGRPIQHCGNTSSC